MRLNIGSGSGTSPRTSPGTTTVTTPGTAPDTTSSTAKAAPAGHRGRPFEADCGQLSKKRCQGLCEGPYQGPCQELCKTVGNGERDRAPRSLGGTPTDSVCRRKEKWAERRGGRWRGRWGGRLGKSSTVGSTLKPRGRPRVSWQAQGLETPSHASAACETKQCRSNAQTRLAPSAALLAATAGLLTVGFASQLLAQDLNGAFSQGAAMGAAQSQAAAGAIGSVPAGSLVPGTGSVANQTQLFGAAGLANAAQGEVSNCAAQGSGTSFGTQHCNAVNFSQTNPARRVHYTPSPGNPLFAASGSLVVAPAGLAASLAGAYSGCSVRTTTGPNLYQAGICHQYLTTQTLTCDKTLSVVAQQTPGCTAGQFLAQVTADPCPLCFDTLAFDFSCAAQGYTMHVYTRLRSNGQVFMDLGTQAVPGALNTQIAKTAGPSRIDGYNCYQTFYSQNCAAGQCTLDAWFVNPCQATSYLAANTFVMPTTVSLSDAWNDQCTALEARAQ
jgi:hypothetical protein